MKKIKDIIASRANRLTLILVVVVAAVLIIGIFAYTRLIAGRDNNQIVGEEVDLNFDPEGPYAVLYPRNDGNALVLNIKRTSSYDSITYELAYSSEGIDRGVTGEINTQEKKGEYEQEVLFGTCSRNVCKYDPDVENGTLTLHIRKGNQAYRMITQWHLQKPVETNGKLVSGDEHFTYTINPKHPGLSLMKYTIINDLTGAPKLPNNQQVTGKVYAVNTPVSVSLPEGSVSAELADKPSEDSKIYQYQDRDNSWKELDSKISGSTFTSPASSGGIFTVMSPIK